LRTPIGRPASGTAPITCRERIVELISDVTRIGLFARERVDGWDAWGNELGGLTSESDADSGLESATLRLTLL
jgi:N6-adenosine-specific RNA methylase IME4